jgi:phage terminase small subunit
MTEQKIVDKKKLTIKQENFCLTYVETGNASEAYRKAGYSPGMSDATVNEAASRLLKHSKVIARLEELRKPIIERHKITVDDLIAELDENRLAALQAETVQSSAATAATMAKAKLLGYMTDKVDLTSSDGTMSPKGKSLSDFYTDVSVKSKS